MDTVREILHKMSLEEKIRLCSGASFWESEKMDRYGIPSFFMSDGPHGLRTQKGSADHLGINESEKSTCFPAACASAASWDPDLLYEMGKAIAEEALQNGVDIVLGPGINIKRNPLCGRNFEYFSEDPYLAGKLAAAWIRGVQEQGVGTSLKHFAANNQEADRLVSDSLVDERALREIYLAGFETAVKESHPETVMCSYNKINGVYSSDNRQLMTDVLRKEWGFNGFVMTDWGALNDRVAAFKAGCDLEMPTSGKMFDAEVKKAVEEGRLSEADIDASAERLIRFALKAEKTREAYASGGHSGYDEDAHHALAKKIARESAVLMKNENRILPLAPGTKAVLIGAMAETVRYQGAGSSHINPTRLPNMVQSMRDLYGDISYYPGCELDGRKNGEKLKAAVEGAKEAEAAVVVIGLPDAFESEGYDRQHMDLPESHLELVREVASVNGNVIVVLMGGSPVELPWTDDVKAVLNMYLGGQAAGEAAAELLCGVANPCGKLADTWPVRYEDVSSSETFGVNPRQAAYAESIYVGYRYYDKAGLPVRFPFGYGLSYTDFSLSSLTTDCPEGRLSFSEGEAKLTVTCRVKNTGERAGAEIVQLYVSDRTKGIFKAEKELKGFQKVFLMPGEEQTVTFVLDRRSFAFYDTAAHDWEVLSGKYAVRIGTSSRDICLEEEIEVCGTVEKLPCGDLPGWYVKPQGKPSVSDFEKIFGREIKPYAPTEPGEFTLMNTFNDMKENPLVRQIMEPMKAGILQGRDENDPEMVFTLSIVFNTPLLRLVQQSGGQTPLGLMQAAVACANGDTEVIAQLAELTAGQ